MSFEQFLEPLGYLLDPSKRIFWGYVIGALVVASLVTAKEPRLFGPTSTAAVAIFRKVLV
jgi:hypothetical protein